MVVEVHVLQAGDNLDSQAGIQEDSCKEREDHLDDQLEDPHDDPQDGPQDGPQDDHQDDHLEDLLDDLEHQDDQLVDPLDPLGVVEVGRADQDQVQVPDLRTLHCSSCEPV